MKMLKVPPDWSEGYDYFKVTLDLDDKEYYGSYAIKKGVPYSKAMHQDACANVEDMIRASTKRGVS